MPSKTAINIGVRTDAHLVTIKLKQLQARTVLDTQKEKYMLCVKKMVVHGMCYSYK